MTDTFADYFFKATECFSDCVALVDPEKHTSLTFGEMEAKTDVFVKKLEEIGVKRGARIGTFVGNSIEFLLFCLAANRCGCVLCPLNPAYKRHEFEHYFEEAGVQWILTESEYMEKLRKADFVATKGKNLILLPSGNDPNHNNEELEVLYKPSKPQNNDFGGAERAGKSQDDDAIIFFSSGTTGKPKGVILSQRSLIAHLTIANEMQLDRHSDFVTLSTHDTVYGVLPFFHAGGFLTVFVMLVQGAKVLINNRFDEDTFFKNIERHQVTVLNVVPPILELLAFSPKADPQKNLSSLRYIYVGAAAVRRELEPLIFKKFWRVQLIQLYGSTESGIFVLMVPKKAKYQEQLATKPGTCGILLPGVKAKIFPPDSDDLANNPHFGELLVKTSTQMKGYINPDLNDIVFDEDGYYHTGDLVRTDSEGFYYIVGRLKEMIKVRGWQVSPYELEEAIRKQFAQIVDIGIVGLPEDKDGEQPAAVVVLAPGTMLSAGEIEAFVEENFISYKRLTAGVHFLDSLPRTASGKLDRLALKRMLLELEEYDD